MCESSRHCPLRVRIRARGDGTRPFCHSNYLHYAFSSGPRQFTLAMPVHHGFQNETMAPPTTINAPPTTTGTVGVVRKKAKLTICHTMNSVAI